MPLLNSEPQGQSVWPPNYPESTGTHGPGFTQPPPAPAPEPFNPRGLYQALETLERELKRIAQAQAIQREAFRRILEVPEGDLLAIEKRVVNDLYQPKSEVTLESVQQLIEHNLAQHAEELAAAIGQILQQHGIAPAAPAATAPRTPPKDPLDPAPDDYLEEEEDPDDSPEEADTGIDLMGKATTPPPQPKPPAEAMDAFADQLEKNAGTNPHTPRRKKKK